MFDVRAQRSMFALALCLALAACSKTAPTAAPAASSSVAPSAVAQADEPGRFHGKGFSYLPPQGWALKELPGLTNKVALATPADGFAPNLNVVDEEFGGSLDAYLEGNLATLGKLMPEFQKVSVGDMSTDAGMTMKRLVATSRQNDMPIRQVFYMAPGKGRYFVVTCSDLAKHGGAADAACDAAMKTFRVD